MNFDYKKNYSVVNLVLFFFTFAMIGWLWEVALHLFETGNFVKFSLDDAAKKIDISKKSLDDYLLQLRMGRKFGFDFNKNKDAKVGKLRAFVKEARSKKIE